MSEPLKPILDKIVVSGSLHIYISQSARGEFVMGGATDPYALYASRSTLDFKESLAGDLLELFPFLAKARILRQWAGIADMTPDFSPVMGLTPVGNYYIDAGWGTWGFKATPISGKTMATTVATGRPHPLIEASVSTVSHASTRLANAARLRSAIEREAPMKIMPCPLNGPRNITEFVCQGPVRKLPAPDAGPEAWADYAFLEDNLAGPVVEWWLHRADRLLVHRRARYPHRRDPAHLDGRGVHRRKAGCEECAPQPAVRPVIDRSRPVAFFFEGRRYEGFAGDTLAAALLANGVRTLARSFKYRRPRGIFGHGDLDAQALVQVGDEPNVPADRLLLRDGMPPVKGQNRSGSVRRDRGAWPGLLGRFMPVGFYYRSFFRPAGAWRVFEPILRRVRRSRYPRPAAHHVATTRNISSATSR